MLVTRLTVFTVVAMLGGYALAYWLGAPVPGINGAMFVLSVAFTLTCAAVVFIGYVTWLAMIEHEPAPVIRIRTDCARLLNPSYLAEKLGPMVLAFLFLGAFGTYKSLITDIQPFYLDGFLSDLDRLMLGTDAWRLSHAIIGPTGTTIVELAYRLWFAELSLSLIFFSVFARDTLKRRFFLAYFALWSLMGFVAATALSSAGPCFLYLIHHPYAERYAGLFPLLRSAPVALASQHMLAAAYRSGAAGAFLGISAMPSLHVAFAALVTLAMRHINKFAFAGALLFYVLIFLGSVHLGFHYLSDGVAGTLGTLIIWRWLRPAERLNYLGFYQRQLEQPPAVA